VPEGANFKEITLHKVIIGGDPADAEDLHNYPGCVLINVPKHKIHAQDLLTNAIKNLGIANQLGQIVRLEQVADVSTSIGPSEIRRYNRQRLITIKANTQNRPLGEVMKESASAALSFIRSNAVKIGIPVDFFEETDIHIHVPAGAIPKDGPSAGVTMLAALASLLTNRTVKSDLAMTGEITLRGLVLPVGGIKEKVLAAHRAGIKTIILPKWNRKDLEEIPSKVRKEMNFVFVNDMLEVLNIALSRK